VSFTIGNGVNVSHWLSQSPARGKERRNWFTRADVNRIAGMGLDHIRIPIDESHLWTENGSRQAEGFDLLSEGLDWAQAAGLRSIVDLHIIRSHFFNDTEEPPLFTVETEMERFGSLWTDLSQAFSSRSTEMVAYELLNEPVARDDRRWNQVYPYALGAIREREPERAVVLGSNHYNQCRTFPDLAIPDDRNIILTYHYYNPMLITHYGARWTHAGSYDGPVQYPGRPIPESEADRAKTLLGESMAWENRHMDREVMRCDMEVAVTVARERGLAIHCGEFGCYHRSPREVKERWYRDMAGVFRELGVSWSCWDYKGAFGIVDRNGKETGVHHWLLEEKG
jgi:endoglucanase